MTLSANELRQRVQQTTHRTSRLAGMQEANALRKVELTQAVAAAKARQGLGDEVKLVFGALQVSAHERSVGTFERLLTALLNDVLPDEGRIRFLPKYRDNTTWLDVALEKNGNLEDILEGNGGAVTNVVSAGLRYASLTRTKNRRFMVLDEPDCWMKKERIPAFIRVIAQVAKLTNVQTLFISHFGDLSQYPGLVNVVELSSGPDKVRHANVVGPLVTDWTDDTTPGIRCIELHNFRAHTHTVIPCFPGATAFVGDNNEGKSAAISGSIKAVAYGESDDSVIHHDASEAKVIIHLENQTRVEWTRSRKGSPAVMYRQFNGDTMVHECRQPSRNMAPDWCQTLLGINKVDALDIQVGNQKSPVFLLDETASTRAQILSLGRESSHLKTLMQDYEAIKADDSATVKQGELELGRVVFNLSKLEPIPDVSVQLEKLSKLSDAVCTEMVNRERTESLLARWDTSRAILDKVEAELSILADIPELFELTDVTPMLALADRIDGHKRLLTAIDLPQIPALPELVDVTEIHEIGEALRTRRELLAAMDLPVIPVLPELIDVVKIQGIGDALESRRQLLASMDLPSLPTLPELVDVAEIADIGKNLSVSQQRLAALAGLPESLPELPVLTDLSELTRHLEGLTAAVTRAATAEERLPQAIADAAVEEKALDGLIAELGVCPLCDSPLDKGSDHAVHAH